MLTREQLEDVNFQLRCRNDFVYFCEKVLDLEMTEYHQEIAGLPMSHRYLCILVPRGHSKTSLFSIAYPLWRLFREKDIEICLVSSSLDQSGKIFSKVQYILETNPFFSQLLPTDRFTAWNKSLVTTSNHNLYYVKPFTSSGRGMQPHYAIYDDLLRDVDNMFEAKDIFWSVFFLAGQANSCQHIIVGCVTPDTLVYTQRGLREIGSLIKHDKSKKKYLPLNKGVLGRDGWDKTSYFYVNGKTKTKKVELVGGYELECSEKHPIWTCRRNNRKWVTKRDISWVEAKDLEVGDRVALKLGARVFGKKATISEDLAYFYGLYVAEGSSELKGNANRVTITNKHPSIVAFLKDKFGFHKTDDYHNRKNSKELVKKMQQYGLPFVKCSQKWIPSKILLEPKRIQASFLQGLYDGDGSSTRVKSGNVKITLSSTSKKQLQTVQQMLLNFGIVSHLNKLNRRGHFKKDGSYIRSGIGYNLAFGGEGAVEFMDEIGFRIGYKVKYPVMKNIRRFRMPFGFIWKKIKKIEKGESYTVDFVIPQNHSFISNGIVSHNTPISLDDLYAEIENHPTKKKNWLLCKKRAVREDKDGNWKEPLWETRFPLSKLREIKESIGSYRFEREMMCRPTAVGESLYPTNMVLNCLDYNLEFSEEVTGVPLIGADFAMSERASGDFNAFIVVDNAVGETYLKKTDKGTVEISNPVFIRHIMHYKGSVGQIERISRLHEKYKGARIIGDESGVGAKFIRELRESYFSVEGQDFQPAKRNMILLNLRTLIEKNRLVIPAGDMSSPLTNILLRELSGFRLIENKNTGHQSWKSNLDHDDTVMALAMAVKDITIPRKVMKDLIYGA